MATTVIRTVLFGDEADPSVGDLLIRDGRIVARGVDLAVTDELDEEPVEEFDATGLVALPGAIDTYAQLANPKSNQAPADDLGSGTIAAARGGVTTIIAPVLPAANETLDVAFRDACNRAAGQVFVDWGFLVGIGQPASDSSARLQTIAGEAGFLGAVLDLDAIDHAATAGPGALLRIAALAGLPITVHAAGRRGAAAEQSRVQILGQLGALADIAPHIAPVSTVGAVAELGLATASTSLAHLCLTELPDPLRVAPPLGTDLDRAALWSALVDGTLEGVISDHRSEPLNGFDGWVGLASIELMLPALLSFGVATGAIDLPTLCAITAERPARRLGIWPQKGSLQVGADGDVVLVDPAAVWTVDPSGLEGRGKAPAWHGQELTGRVVHVFSRGQQIVNDGFPLFRPGRGRPVST
ncbi:MAG: dihydroorotase family protein [Thermoleophilia bacterium]